MGSELEDQIELAADVLLASRYVIALVGAGISVESGIPPFRGKGGLWTKHGEPPMDGYQRFLARSGIALAADARRGATRTTSSRRRFGLRGRTRRTSRWRGWSRWACCATQSRRTSTTCTSTPAASPSPRSTAIARRCAASTAARGGRGREFVRHGSAAHVPAVRRSRQERHRDVRRADPARVPRRVPIAGRARRLRADRRHIGDGISGGGVPGDRRSTPAARSSR